MKDEMGEANTNLSIGEVMNQAESDRGANQDEGDPSSFLLPPSSFEKPWVEIENGRYQPRRIRGSCLGRELG